MNKEIVEMTEYVCDHICPMPEKMFDQEKLEAYCNDKCNLKLHLSGATKIYIYHTIPGKAQRAPSGKEYQK